MGFRGPSNTCTTSSEVTRNPADAHPHASQADFRSIPKPRLSDDDYHSYERGSRTGDSIGQRLREVRNALMPMPPPVPYRWQSFGTMQRDPIWITSSATNGTAGTGHSISCTPPYGQDVGREHGISTDARTGGLFSEREVTYDCQDTLVAVMASPRCGDTGLVRPLG